MNTEECRIRIASIQQGGRVEDLNVNLRDLLNLIDEAACGSGYYIVATELSSIA